MSFTDFLKNSRKYTADYAEAKAVAETPRIRRPLSHPIFNINRLHHNLPQETRRWIRSEADERAAVEHGCRFVEAQGQYVVDWVERTCVLYEGELAGSSMLLDDWQYEMYMQGYGWQWFNEEWEQKRAGAGWLRRYLVMSGWIPKKNAKSPTLAANGLYLFAGDGEQGQKCFSLATTRDQALIAHTHALNFVRQSPGLLSHCRIDATTATIHDTWTNSTYGILCGDKGSNKVSKEGINGSLIIDETHVVNADFMKVISRAGISRRQPFRIQLSTAGADTGGYGYEQYSLGRMNLKAAEENRDFDFRFYHFEHSIPQETSIDELRDPTKIDDFIRMSNPTLGRIISLTEARHDWKTCLKSDTDLISFAMYRLNQWNTGGGAFIAGSDWNRCKRLFTLADVKDHPCVVGVDMSRIRDMTAVVVIWAVPKDILIPENPLDPNSKLIEREINVPHILPFFYVPQRTIAQYSGHIDIPTIAQNKTNNLFVTQTNVVKAETIAEHIAYIDANFDCRGVASDQAYSRALSACLAATHGWDVDSRFFLIPQTAVGIGPAIEQLQGCVLDQELVHNGSKVMDWQLGNITMVEDSNNNRRFSKPHNNDYRKIDGWAALSNGIFLMMNDPELYPGRTLSMKIGTTAHL